MGKIASSMMNPLRCSANVLMHRSIASCGTDTGRVSHGKPFVLFDLTVANAQERNHKNLWLLESTIACNEERQLLLHPKGTKRCPSGPDPVNEAPNHHWF
jgi:hypothetical protein